MSFNVGPLQSPANIRPAATTRARDRSKTAMSPPGGIVYDNVNRAGDSNDYGLFGGVSFFVHQRVPTRSDILNAITSNGGRVVKLEKLANVVIADHARKDAPANSVSWKYIDDSVKRGELVDIAGYRIGGPAGPARNTVGTTAPTKQTRTPFTAEEDRMLIEWVRKQLYPKGNECYKEFAEMHPRHTWQSYRDHYIKYLSDRPDEGAAADESPRPAPLRQQSPAPQPAPFHHQSPALQPQPRTPTAVSSPLSQRKRDFTAEEDKILTDHVRQREAQGLCRKDIFNELAAKYPDRTASSWSLRWILLSKRLRDEERPAAESSRVSPPSWVPQLSRAPQPSLGLPHRDHRAPRQSTHAEPAPIDRKTQIEMRARQNLEERAAIIIQRCWRARRLRNLAWPVNINEETSDVNVEMPSQLADDMVDEPWIEEAAVQHEANMHVEAGIRPSAGVEMTNHYSHQSPSPTSSAPQRSAKEQFYHDIQGYYENNGLPLKKWLTLGDTALELWDLWKAVTDQDEESGFRDWEQIAETLNFNWIANPNVTNQLQGAFDEHLQGFEEELKSFEEEIEDGEEMEDEEEVEDEVEIKDEEEEGGSQQGPAQTPEFLESSPPAPSRKRRQEHSPILGFSPNKRPRYNPDHEIPETPEKPEHAGQTTPSTGRTVRTGDPMSIRTKWQQGLAQTALTSPIPEPETQDFTFRQHPGHGEAEPDLLDRDPLSEDSAVSEFPSLKELIKNPAKFKNQRKHPSRSDSSSDGFGTPMKSPPTRPTRTASAAYPSLARSEPTRSTAPNPAPRPLLTGRGAPRIYSPPRRASSGVSHATRPPVPQPKPSPLQPPREVTTRRPSAQPKQPPKPKQSPKPKSLAGLSEAELEYHIREYVKDGFRRDDVVTALQATNMVVDDVEFVLLNMRGGQVPGNSRRVWTTKDDDDLKFVIKTDQAGLRQGSLVRRKADEKLDRLVEKHGPGNVEERRNWVEY